MAQPGANVVVMTTSVSRAREILMKLWSKMPPGFTFNHATMVARHADGRALRIGITSHDAEEATKRFAGVPITNLVYDEMLGKQAATVVRFMSPWIRSSNGAPTTIEPLMK